ncbi:winged helix-turn-helix transcriptional regulator [Streptomyces celluloflavus]|uniref:winged helix-turn-helix transcriptional regulator n=1 Tax=Streptomyces celluloflavus TaxID=58344 RepID=UPI00364C6C4D
MDAEPPHPISPCPIALGIIGEHWSLVALRKAFFGVHRFDRIAARTGVGLGILASRLMRARRVRRPGQRAVQEHPPRYEYVSTEAGGPRVAARTARPHGLGDRYATNGEPPTA